MFLKHDDGSSLLLKVNEGLFAHSSEQEIARVQTECKIEESLEHTETGKRKVCGICLKLCPFGTRTGLSRIAGNKK